MMKQNSNFVLDDRGARKLVPSCDIPCANRHANIMEICMWVLLFTFDKSMN